MDKQLHPDITEILKVQRNAALDKAAVYESLCIQLNNLYDTERKTNIELINKIKELETIIQTLYDERQHVTPTNMGKNNTAS